MEWYIGIILYLAAGGIFTVLDHLFAHVARSYGRKYPDPFHESRSLLWRLFHFTHGIILIISFFLVLPLICQWFDIHHISEMLDKADRADRLWEVIKEKDACIKEKDTRIKELENKYTNLLLVDADRPKAFELVSQFAEKSNMSIKDYCRYCMKQQYMLDGESEAEAAKMADEWFTDDFPDIDAAYKVVETFAHRDGKAIVDYIHFCKQQAAQQSI